MRYIHSKARLKSQTPKIQTHLTTKEERILDRITYVTAGTMLGITLVSGTVLLASNYHASATSSGQSTATVNVKSSCSISSDSNNHSANIINGQTAEIGTTTFKALCNDANGYRIYAIGVSDGTNGSTDLISSNGGANIATGTTFSGDASAWGVKFAAGTGTNQTTTPPTLVSPYNDGAYHAIPNTYAVIASRDSMTDMSSDTAATGSYFTATYQAYVSPTQQAGTYTGKVKYGMLHPNDDATVYDLNNVLTSTLGAAGAGNSNSMQASDGNYYYKMQNVTTTICDNTVITGPGSAARVIDVRDGSLYYITKLDDGKCWMLDNLALDLTDTSIRSNILSSNSVATTNASDTSLGYLFGTTTGTTSDKYATSAVSTTWNNRNDTSNTATYSYSDPRIYTALKDTTGNTANQYGVGSHKYGIYYNYCAATAGSYCYGNGTSQGSSSGSATEDICPANWRMPTGGAAGEYQNLCTILNGGTACANGMSMAATGSNSIQTQLSLPLSGYVYSGSASNQGSNGYFWSSSRGNGYSMYRLYVNASSVYPQDNNYRYDGFSVRCVLGS